MPVPVIIVIFAALAPLAFICLRMVVQGLFEYREEKQNPTLGWTDQDTDELQIMRNEAQRERETCPSCKGTRCWDWRREGRQCGENPTEADGNNDYLTGRHNQFSVIPVAMNWWPTPKSRYGRTRPDLWKRVAGHCQIPLHGPVRTLAAVA